MQVHREQLQPAALAVLLVRFWNAFIAMLGHAADGSLQTLTLEILELLDMTLLGNLVVIMILSGYENFVSKIHAADKSVDRPAWMGRVDFSGLKIKLIGSLVAISVIELLRDFMEKDTLNGKLERDLFYDEHVMQLADTVRDRRSRLERDDAS